MNDARSRFRYDSGVAATRFDEHGVHELVEPLAILRNRLLRAGLLALELAANLVEAPLDAAVDDNGTGEQRADARRDLCIELAGIGPGDLDARQLVRATGFKMLTPQATQLDRLHRRTASLDLN
jgi:hypothetical protein